MAKFTSKDLRNFTKYLNDNGKDIAIDTEKIIVFDLNLQKKSKY